MRRHVSGTNTNPRRLSAVTTAKKIVSARPRLMASVICRPSVSQPSLDGSMQPPGRGSPAHRCGDGRLWTRLRCGRGHFAHHPGGVVPLDLDAACWCGAMRVAATEFRLEETRG